MFKLAGLRLVREQVQEGLPEGLYVVKLYVNNSFSCQIFLSHVKVCSTVMGNVAVIARFTHTEESFVE